MRKAVTLTIDQFVVSCVPRMDVEVIRLNDERLAGIRGFLNAIEILLGSAFDDLESFCPCLVKVFPQIGAEFGIARDL